MSAIAETKQAQLNAERVRQLMSKCLFMDDEMPEGGAVPDGAIRVEGIVNPYAFHAGRVSKNTSEIRECLAELPDEFMSSGGGGWSFLQACMDKHGNHWAEHPTMGALFALGEAAGLVKPLMPREMWPLLPGGVPYYVVDLDAAAAKAEGSRP